MADKYKIVGVKEDAYKTLRALKYKMECPQEKIMQIALKRLEDDFEKGNFDLTKKFDLEMQKAI